MKFKHIPVLLKQSIEGLNIKPNGIYVDGTVGGAGHSSYIIEKLSNKGLLIAIDKDDEALKEAKEKLKKYNNVKFIKGNHDDISQILESLHIEKVDGILLDLGVSSYQIDEAKRGFSYINEGILDMRMDKTQKLTAKEIVNTYKEEKLSEIIYKYGEEKYSKKIAKAICEYRKKEEIKTTTQLSEIIKKAVPLYKKEEGHPAKRTFQALRIETNNEIEPLKQTIKECINCLNSEGRLCVITFHSLEDRAVKQAYVEAVGVCKCPKNLPYCVCGVEKLGEIINKKPITADDKEQEENSRSKSAKLRIFQKR